MRELLEALIPLGGMAFLMALALFVWCREDSHVAHKGWSQMIDDQPEDKNKRRKRKKQ